jgi:hypothetical protein
MDSGFIALRCPGMTTESTASFIISHAMLAGLPVRANGRWQGAADRDRTAKNLIKYAMAGDQELEVLLSLDGFEFEFTGGHRVRIAARLVEPTRSRPHGMRYSLTLHDPAGERLYGIDNAHGVRRGATFDHRHIYGRRRMMPYIYRGPVELLEDFYREVERILRERSAP